MCNTPSIGESMSVLGIYNSTSFGTVLNRERTRFLTLYKRKAMLHHYTEFMDSETIAIADRHVEKLISDYENIENENFIYNPSSQQQQQQKQRSKESNQTSSKNATDTIYKKLSPAF